MIRKIEESQIKNSCLKVSKIFIYKKFEFHEVSCLQNINLIKYFIIYLFNLSALSINSS